jgi:hypothetical protein
LLAAGARVFFQVDCAAAVLRHNVALDATEVRVTRTADVPGAGGYEEDSLAIAERYRIR